MNKSIRFIYFDLGGVVVSNAEAHKRLAKETGRSVEEVQKFLDMTDDLRGRGLHDMKQFLGEFKREFQINHSAVDFADFWSDYLFPIEETHVLIRELSLHYRLGILSNAELGVIALNIQKGKVPDISWSAIIESAQVGHVKPEPEIFRIAERHAATPPGQILLVDDRETNIQAAKKRGWQGMVFESMNITSSITKIRNVLSRTVR